MNPSQFRHHDIITPAKRMKRESQVIKNLKATASKFFLDDVAVTIAAMILILVGFGGLNAL